MCYHRYNITIFNQSRDSLEALEDEEGLKFICRPENLLSWLEKSHRAHVRALDSVAAKQECV